MDGVFLLLFFVAFFVVVAFLFRKISVKMPKNQENKNLRAIAAILPYLLIVLFVLFILWSIYLPGSHGSISIGGWNRMQPIKSATDYTEYGKFSAAFVNTAGTKIEINGLIINETKTRVSCKDIQVSSENQTFIPLKVEFLDQFNITALCPPKRDESEYELSISIQYSTIIGGINTSHTETGSIKSCVGCINH
jgi:hypothetical protein